VYTKNLEQLLRLLRASRQSGLLIVEPSDAGVGLWQGLFHLVEGTVAGCQVKSKEDGRVRLSGDEALQWLMTQGKLEWRMEEKVQFPDGIQPSPGQSKSAPLEERGGSGPIERVTSGYLRWIPKRTQKGLKTSAQTLGSFEHLQVFTLINGQNSVEGITRILRKPEPGVVSILQELKSAGLIE
jgi:hypothetical protein